MKKSIKIIVLLAFFLFLYHSCNTRKRVTQREMVVYKSDTLYKRDSIFITKDKVILLPSVNTELISNPCDSVGNLRVIEKIIRIPYGQVEIRSEGNNLVAKINTDSISSVYESEYGERNVKQLSRINELEREKSEWVKCNDFYRILFFVSLGVNVVFMVVGVCRSWFFP